MARLLFEIDTIGAQADLVYLPHSEDPYLTYDQFYSIEEQYFDRLCEEKQLRCLNLRGEFQRETSLGYQMRIGGHWFYNGHASVTKDIKSFLEA
ncbi:MAG: hypothetical protein P8J68_07655 [Arenicellaceae bacterium]|nr:hypothetical protein [Arenicellaceae bacterium]